MVKIRNDQDGFYYQAGDNGFKYRFNIGVGNEKQQAMDKAKKQLRAIQASVVKTKLK